MEDGLRVKLRVKLIEEETEANTVSMRELLASIPYGKPFLA